MEVRIILVEETGEEVIAETFDANAILAMGEHFDKFVSMRIQEIYDQCPEARGIYREEVKSWGELRAEQWQAIYEEELAWALEHEDDIDEDPEEYAMNQADDYFRNDFFGI